MRDQAGHVNTRDADNDGDPSGANPITRARTREARPPRKLRKGRERCAAHRRDGHPCQAPAVKGALVCRHHGGSAPQVRIAAQHLVLLEARYAAYSAYEQAIGTTREFDARCKRYTADRAVREYEAKLERLAELRAAVKRLNTGEI